MRSPFLYSRNPFACKHTAARTKGKRPLQSLCNAWPWPMYGFPPASIFSRLSGLPKCNGPHCANLCHAGPETKLRQHFPLDQSEVCLHSRHMCSEQPRRAMHISVAASFRRAAALCMRKPRAAPDTNPPCYPRTRRRSRPAHPRQMAAPPSQRTPVSAACGSAGGCLIGRGSKAVPNPTGSKTAPASLTRFKVKKATGSSRNIKDHASWAPLLR
jgi:hypothetical protein